MIKKFKLYILLAAVVLSTTSCLDKMPEDSIPFDEAIQTVDDVNLAVIGIYDAFKSSSLYSGSLTLLPDLQTDLVYGVNGNTNIYGEIGVGKTYWQPIPILKVFMLHCTM